MAGSSRRLRFSPEKIGEFLEASYSLETTDQTWLIEVMEAARAVWGRGGPVHGAIYDASDVAAFRVKNLHVIDFTGDRADCLMRGLGLVSPTFVARTFRCLLANSTRQVGLPEMLPMLEEMGALGYPNATNINGLDPLGLGVFIALWAPDATELPRMEMAVYRRMAHHIGAAHRCRRRLHESQAHRSSVDATESAEAVLDARKRVVHATGPALAKEARENLIEAANARDRARTSKGRPEDSLRGWRPLTSARWTLVDSFERSGTRYIVARENQAEIRGLALLSDRERQAVAYVAIGQSTKETAYALGISDVTVRVLLARAASKLGVRSRADLLDHAEVRPLRPHPTSPESAAPTVKRGASAPGAFTPHR
jgi:DNA-binding CsgD family transcriptional regulator